MKNIFIFDVESVSLHGVGFAVGALVLDKDGNELDRFELLSTEGIELANDWVKQNVIPKLFDMPKCDTLLELRNKFYEFYIKHKDTSGIWADVAYPVETNFLNQIVQDNLKEREWMMPYPLNDISTIIDVSINRAETCGIENLRIHHPLDDCRASVKFLYDE